jgi:glutaminyl-tRNA synthetase
VPEPDSGGDFKSFINPHSLETVTAKCEPALANAHADERYQFERLGYFSVDAESAPDRLVFNRTIGLRDTWSKIEQRDKK